MHLTAWILWLFFILLLVFFSRREILAIFQGQWQKQYAWLPFILLMAVLFFVTVSGQTVETMSDQPFSFKMTGLLFLAMLLGMLANYVFFKEKGEAFDWHSIKKPFCVSPMVFIPLAQAYEKSMVVTDTFTSAQFMMLMVAFQNGFFWKEFFDNLQKKMKKQK